VVNPRVVIIGGGFGGLACAKKLEGKAVDVLLVDGRNYHLFTPLLYQVATALLRAPDIAYPFRAVFRGSRNVRFLQALVTGLDLDGRYIRTKAGHELRYDYLVLATGSTNNYFGNETVADATVGMKTLAEAQRLRNRVLACLERASQAGDEQERREWLTFVVVGGGPTGVEYAGALGELMRLVLGRDYPELRRDDARIVLVEAQERLLATFPDKLARYAQRQLERRGVEVDVGSLVTHATDAAVTLSSGRHIRTRTIVWSAGVRADPPEGAEVLTRSRSERLSVDERLRVTGKPGIYAIGDVASARQDGAELPMLSPPAMQEGRYVARAILADAAGSGDRGGPFRYRDKGTMATIGRTAAIASIGPLKLRGFIGWAAWLTIHLYYLVGYRNRLAVFGSWGWNYLRKDRPIRIITRIEPDAITDELMADVSQHSHTSQEA
jgi:NADH:ubiquinone reductase (H+-translocating)